MGIFNKAIPNIRSNNLNQVRVSPVEEYYVDDIFDPLFNAEVKKQLTAKYGNPVLGVIGGYMEGIDNALLGQNDQWGILGPGMGILSGFGRSMDKAGDFILGGVTEGVKFATGQGFENPIRNIFVEDEDYSGARLLAAMGNSMAGIADAPKLTEQDFTGLWNIPSTGIELMTDPGILGGMMSKGAKTASKLDLGEQVTKQQASSKLASVGSLLAEYDDLMAKISMDITAPGLRQSIKALRNKIAQKFGTSSAKPWADVVLNKKATPEERVAAQEALRKDSEITSYMEMADELDKVEEAIAQAETSTVSNLNTAQAAAGMGLAIPNAIKEEVSKSKTEQFADTVDAVRSRELDLVRDAYFKTVEEREAYLNDFAKNRDSLLQDFNKSLLTDARANIRKDKAALEYAKLNGLLNVDNVSYYSAVPEDVVQTNIQNYEALQNIIWDVYHMDKAELEAYGINPEYAEQISFGDLNDDEIAAGLFYEFTPNESARNAVLRLAGIDPKGLKGLSLETPVTFSPSEYLGRSETSLVKGLKVSEALLYDAFESSGISLRSFKSPAQLKEALLNPKTVHGSRLQTAFPNDDFREHLVDELSILLFPQKAPKNLKLGAVDYLRKLNDLSNEIITQNKARLGSSTPLYEQLVAYADTSGVDFLDAVKNLRSQTTFTDWVAMRPNASPEYLDDISILENLADISEHPENLNVFIRSAQLQPELRRRLKEVEDFWDSKISEEYGWNAYYEAKLSDIRDPSKKPNYDLVQLSRLGIGAHPDDFNKMSPENLNHMRVVQSVRRIEFLEKLKAEALAKETASYVNSLSPKDKEVFNIINDLPLSNIDNVFSIQEDLKEYEQIWQNLISEYELANNSLQKDFIENLVGAAETFQRDIYNPIRNKFSIGYVTDNLELKEGGAHAVDVYGNRIHREGSEATSYDDLLNEKHNRGNSIVPKKATDTPTKIDYSSDKYKQQMRTDYGKRNIGYAGDADSYELHRTYNAMFRIDPSAFKDPDKFKHLRDTVLRKIANHYQVKLKPEFFFKDIPSGTLIRNIDQSTLDDVAKLIIDDGREVVRAFNAEVRPVAEALLKDGVIPWVDPKKFIPKVSDPNYSRIIENQAKMQHLLGYSDNPHPLYKEFRVIKSLLPIESFKSNPKKFFFKTPDADWHTRIASSPKLRYASNLELLKRASKDAPELYNRVMRAVQFHKFKGRLSEKMVRDFALEQYYTEVFKGLDYSDVSEMSKYVPAEYAYRQEISYNHFTVDDLISIQNAKISSDWHSPVKVPNVREGVERVISNASSRLPNNLSKNYSKLKQYDALFDDIERQIEQAPTEQAAEIIADFPSPIEAAQNKVLDEAVPNHRGIDEMRKPSPGNSPSGETPDKDPAKILFSEDEYRVTDLVHEAMVAVNKSKSTDKATLRTKFAQTILHEAELLMSKYGITTDDIAQYKRAQIYLEGAAVKKENFLDNLASSGFFQLAYKSGESYDKAYNAIQHNVVTINNAVGAHVLVPFKDIKNGKTIIGARWDTSNTKIVNILEKNYSKIDFSKLQDVIRLEKGIVTDAVLKYIQSDKYNLINKVFDKIRQGESEYAKILGFTYDNVHHVKNVRKLDADVANYLDNVLYKNLPVKDLDSISDELMNTKAFKHLRGSWGSRKFDSRFVGYIEDFEADGIRIFEDDAVRIAKGSLGEGSFNNSKFQLYVDLVDNDNFKISQYCKTPDDIRRILYAKLEDGSPSGNLDNFVLVAPRKSADGRVVGFTQFDKTTDLGLQQALNNPDTMLLPAHVLAPLDRVLRKDAKMSNKLYAFINKHLTLPFKFGVLMNPGFIIGNASDAFLKQATTMAHKYNTSVLEELVNVIVSTRDIMVLNNHFDDAYRKFLTHLEAEGVPIAPSHRISELASSDPRIRKALTDYVNNKLHKSGGIHGPILECRLSTKERNDIRLWLTLNNSNMTSTFDNGFQDLDVLAKAKNSSKYRKASNPIDRVLTGDGEYDSSDIRTWGFFVNNPLSRATMNASEKLESLVRSASILNDFRHKGMDSKWFSEYFNTLDELKEATKIDPKSSFYRDELRKKFNFDMSEAINTMHNANFDYERMTDFTDSLGTFIPFPTFFIKNLGYWLEVMIEHPQYLDHAISVQEGLWGDRDTSEDKFAAEAKGRGAIPVSVGGQNLSSFFKGIYKPTPLQSMFGAFSLINSPVSDIYYRLHPLISGGLTATSKLPPIEPIAADLIPSEEVKYRPYSTDMYERNVTRDDPNFNPLAYTIHRMNPVERTVQNAIRLPDKLKENKAQLSDFLPSIFQPDF